MPTEREREYYRMGFADGTRAGRGIGPQFGIEPEPIDPFPYRGETLKKVKSSRRKLSAWNKFVKANSKKPRFRLRSGSPNLKKLAVAFRKTPAGRKKKRR